MSDSIKSILFVFLLCFGTASSFIFIMKWANHMDSLEKEEHAMICTPDHYVSSIRVADDLSKITCMNDEGKERSIFIKK